MTTVSMILPQQSKIVQITQVAVTDLPLIRNVKNAIRNDTKPRYKDETIQQYLLESCALYPGFRSLNNIDQHKHDDVFNSIVLKALQLSEVPVKVPIY